MTIGVVDVGIGNIGSLRGALFGQGWDVTVVREPTDLHEITHLILPGVGSFPSAMARLEESALVTPILEHAANKKPILGICLGMQLLASIGTEVADTHGLGLISGTVAKLGAGRNTRLPHVGWNTLESVREHPILEGVRKKVDFYFVHSYAFYPTDQNQVIGTTEYGETFCAFVGKKSIVGVQFHPEKSQRNGLRLLDNFCSWDGSC